jgi:hypothetical protein
MEKTTDPGLPGLSGGAGSLAEPVSGQIQGKFPEKGQKSAKISPSRAQKPENMGSSRAWTG